MASLWALAKASAIRPLVWPLAMLGSRVGGFMGDNPGAEIPGWFQSSWSSAPHCLEVRQVVCCSRSALGCSTCCSSGTGPHPAFDGENSSCPITLFVGCQSSQFSAAPGRPQRQRNLHGLRKVCIPWLTGVSSTGTSTLASATAVFFFPLSFFAIGGGQSQVQVAVPTWQNNVTENRDRGVRLP